MKLIYLLLGLLFIGCGNQLSNDKLITQLTEEFALEKKIYKDQNQKTLGEIQSLYVHNPNKIKPFREQSKLVHEKTQAILDKISGKYTIDELSNLVNEHLDWIEESTYNYALINNKVRLYKENIKSIEISKSESNFQKEKISFELLSLEQDIILFIKSVIFDRDYEFNNLKPVLVFDKPETKLGEIFSAKVMLVPYDTTRNNKVFINVKSEQILIPFENGAGIYRETTRKKGIKHLSGTYRYFDRYGDSLDLPFEFDYNVN